MTDRINGLYVILDKDIRDDDVEVIVNAIRALKCVLSVEKNVSSFDFSIAEARARQHLGQKLWDILYPKF